MAESNSNKDQVAELKLSMQQDENPTNLLQRFSPGKVTQEPKSTDSEKAEVNLGLSLGGLYSANSTEKLLTRSSSVAGVITLNKEAGGSKTTPPRAASLPSLERSSSLPAETGQRVLSVKDLQALKRMEAKKRLTAKGAKAAQLSEVASAPNAGNGACCAVVKFKAEGYITYLSGPGGVAARESTTRTEPLPVEKDVKPVVTSAGKANGKHANPTENELENASKKVKVSNGNASNGNASNGNVANGNASNRNVANGNASNGNVSDDNVSDDTDSNDNILEKGMEAISKMPCVRTTGNGPNGRRIEGFLYQYLKGNVRIVCVCHGSFLSPAEFVKHAGGGEVEHPMRHITVCTNTFPF